MEPDARIEVKCKVTPREHFAMGENTAEAVSKSLCAKADTGRTGKPGGGDRNSLVSCSSPPGSTGFGGGDCDGGVTGNGHLSPSDAADDLTRLLCVRRRIIAATTTTTTPT